MTIKDMHYDFKKKLNKIDSQQNRNLRVPEIDWTLNEAQELFIKMVARPRLSQYMGFEFTQRSIDDIRSIVVSPNLEESDSPIFSPENPGVILITDNIAKLPKDYWSYVKGYVKINKEDCTNILARLHIRRHEELFEESNLDNSSFEWRHVNGVFQNNNIKVFDDGTFSITKLYLTYLKKPSYMHNAEDFNAGEYKLPSGELLRGHVNCSLPWQTHREIVDIAVMIATSEMQSSNFQNALFKLRLNQLQ